jgi:hypothetical protein
LSYVLTSKKEGKLPSTSNKKEEISNIGNHQKKIRKTHLVKSLETENTKY